MIVLIRNKKSGVEYIEKGVIAVTLDDGNIELIYDGDVLDNAKYPSDSYEIIKFRKEKRNVD